MTFFKIENSVKTKSKWRILIWLIKNEYDMNFGIVKESLEKWVCSVHDVIILWYPKKQCLSRVTEIGADFVTFPGSHCMRRDADPRIGKRRFQEKWASRWGRAAKVNKIAFSLGRCRKSEKSHSHAAWESKKKMTPMQHGSAKSGFCDTSSARMLVRKCYKILLLWILVNLGGWESG